MKRTVWSMIAGSILLSAFTAQPVFAQVQGGDLLNEAPLTKVPAEMTFEEYRDMNRRLTIGLALAAIPVPGMIHFYADEKKTGWLVLGTAAVGLTSILAGAAIADEGDFPDSDFDVLVLNPDDKDKERRFEKIPVQITDTETTYQLQEIHREVSGAGIALVALGAAILIGDIAFDLIHGIKIIEEKRDRVRFKYGKTLGISIEPDFDLGMNSAGLQLSFNL
ncbi:MAG: hypothetical protein JSU77_11125 [Fidelibacterota bacterium]|nr:MAG: hypothetical protein JSU77_11125 [Candidatus Neomarinimicrobiota bacterium]